MASWPWPGMALTRRYASHTSHFEISNDFPCDTDLPTRFLPGTLVDRTNNPRWAGPFAPPPLQGLHHYYEPVRQHAPRRYSTPHSFCCLVLFLLPPQTCGRRYRDLPSHVPCSSRRPGSRRLHAGHRQASKRAPARLIPGQGVRPGFDVTYWLSTLHQRFTCVRLPDPHLTPEGAFSSSLTTHGIQPTQHEAV